MVITVFTRICPICKSIVTHKSKMSRDNIQKQNRPCRKCSNNTTERKRKRKEVYDRVLGKKDNSGENNPFYGKKHTPETLLKLKKSKNFSKETKEKFAENLKK